MAQSPIGFVWYELMTTDTRAAASFYEAVLGWRVRDSGMPGMSYSFFSSGNHDVAGLMTMPEAGMPSFWMGYLGVPDVDAASSRLAAAGGTVHRPPDDIPGVGRFAVVADPQGAVLSLITGASDEPATAYSPGQVGHGGWHELHTTDVDAALGFYREQFGWSQADALDMGAMGKYLLFAAGDDTIGGMMKNPDFPEPLWLFYFTVDDIDDAVRRIKDNGGQVLFGPSEVPGGDRIVQAMDPQGALFAIMSTSNR